MLTAHELDRIVCDSDIAGARAALASLQRLRPEAGATGLDIAGGIAVFSGIGSPLTQAYGVGCGVELSSGDIEHLDAFFATRGAEPSVFVSPFSDPALARGIGRLGYAPKEYVSVFVCDPQENRGERDPRVTEAADPDAWAHGSAMGFSGDGELGPDGDLVARIIGSSEGVIPLEVREAGAVVATAGMDVRAGVAGIFGGSTLLAHRGRGWQLVLLRDRLARARAAGARLARGGARAGSGSERNFLRAGFRILYTATLWSRAL